MVFREKIDTPLSDVRIGPETFEIPAGDEVPIPKFPMPDNFSKAILDAYERKDSSLAVRVVLSMIWDDVFGIPASSEEEWNAIIGKGLGSVTEMERRADIAADVRAEIARREHQNEEREREA